MDRLRRVFQISACLVLGLAALTFCTAEGNPLAAVALPLLVFCWLSIDRPGAKGIGPAWSFVLGIVAFGAGALELALGGIESRILAPAHLLAYLSWIFMLQHKESRHYWMLFALAILQMAVASLLTTDAWFGLALGLFLALGLWSLVLLTLYGSAVRVGDSGTAAAPSEPLGLRNAFHPATLRARRSSAVNTVLLDPDEPLIGPRLMGGALVLVVASLAAAGLFFLLIPRVWIDQFRGFSNRAHPGTAPLTGFTEEITLGDMGEILESDDLVMEVELFDHDTAEPIPIEQYAMELGPDPRFRGTVLEQYYNGRWAELFEDHWNRAPRRSAERGALQQRIRLQPAGTAALFGAGNVLTCVMEQREQRTDERVEVRRSANVFRREFESAASRELVYNAISSRSDPSLRGGVRFYLSRCLEIPRTLERLVELSQQLVGSPDNLDALGRARLIESYLSDPAEFRYSLDLAIQDPNADPLEDFLFNRREGHCEYFAAAMAMMLRAVGIPSRLVSGFKGAELNTRTGRLEVRQLHAHAWVEAYIDGEWVTMDPTPQEREEQVAVLSQQSQQSWSRWSESWRHTWDRGLRMSQMEQRQLIYAPLQDGLRDTMDSLRDVRGTAGRIRGFVRGLVDSPERWFSWRGGITAFALLLCLVGLVRLARPIWRLVRGAAGSVSADGDRIAIVPFYERFRKLLADQGLQRARGQTQREFALIARDKLQARLVDSELDELPRELAERFYAVRFGSALLAPAELEDLDRKLDLLDHCLSRQGNGAAAASSVPSER